MDRPQWDPQHYLAFASERTRPAIELLARVPTDAPSRVVDLGCGPGNSTACLRARWPHAHIKGLDSSPQMIAEAQGSGVVADWRVADIATWRPDAPLDVIFSNATLHWLDDLTHLLPRLFGDVAPGGALAFQIPLNFRAASHALIYQLADEEPWAGRLTSIRRGVTMLSAADYYAILEPVAARLDVWETDYLQVLDGPDAVYRWVSGTALQPFVQALDGEMRAAFIAEYKARLAAAYPVRASGKTLFPFRRLFVVAHA